MADTVGVDGNISNAIAFVQVRLRGGWRNLAATGGLYGLALAAGIVAAVRVIDAPPARVYAGLLWVLLGAQAVLLLLMAAARVAAAVRYDVTSRMIESHRLMPVGPGRAIGGYLLGATCQELVLATVTLVAGVPTAAGAGVPLANWLWANAVLALFSGLAWAVLAYLAFVVRSPVGWASVPVLAPLWMSQGHLLTVLPAAGLLAGPLVGPAVFYLSPPTGPTLQGYAASALAQVAVAAGCVAAARRKYARDDAVGLAPGLGLALLATVAAATWAGVALAPEVRPVFIRAGESPGVMVQLVCSLLLLMVMALLPVAAAARLEDEWRRRRRARGDGNPAGPRPLSVPLVAVAAGAIVAALPSLLLSSAAEESVPFTADVGPACAATAAVVLLALVGFGYAGRLGRRLGGPGRPLAAGWFVLTWVGPVVADALRLAQTSSGASGNGLGLLSACSPIGSVIMVWQAALDLGNPGAGLPVAGLVVQALLAGLMATFFYTWRSRRGTGMGGTA